VPVSRYQSLPGQDSRYKWIALSKTTHGMRWPPSNSSIMLIAAAGYIPRHRAWTRCSGNNHDAALDMMG